VPLIPPREIELEAELDTAVEGECAPTPPADEEEEEEEETVPEWPLEVAATSLVAVLAELTPRGIPP